MRRLYTYVLVTAGLFAWSLSIAQDLDPTVVVDRAYEGKLMEVHKPSLEMAVPDTVMKFDLDFDYSVFESPYKGSYEFNPYLLSMKPSAATDAAGRLYLRAGAGYRLHPELDFVWSPAFAGPGAALRMDAYASHRSYVGEYWVMSRDPETGVVDRSDETWSGYDLRSRAGVDMSYGWDSGELELGVGYYGIHQKDTDWDRGYDALDVNFSAGSLKSPSSRFICGLDGHYRYAADKNVFSGDEPDALLEHDFNLSALLGVRMKERMFASLNLEVTSAAYFGLLEDVASEVALVPHYVYDLGILHADLGVRLAKLIRHDKEDVFRKPAKEQIIYPDIDIRLALFPKHLSLFFKAGGGNTINSYASLLEMNPHISIGGTQDLHEHLKYGNDMGVSVERISLTAGLEGRIGAGFSYNLHGGYANYAAGILETVTEGYAVNYSLYQYAGALAYEPYQKTFASVAMRWKNDRLSADAYAVFTDSWGEAFAEDSHCLRPAGFKGSVSFEYNYNRRIFAGMDCSFSGSRTTGDGYICIPGYADLGLYAEYVTSRRLSFWARGGNLLGMTVQRNPLYAEKGAYVTLGVCLNL